MFNFLKQNHVLVALLGSYAVIDMAALWNGAYNHQALSKSACFVLPIVKAAYIFVPQNLLHVAQQECPLDITDVSAGIVFLVLKLFITALMVVSIYLTSFYSGFAKNIELFDKTSAKIGGNIANLMITACTCFAVFMLCFSRYTDIEQNPMQYRSDFAFKISEDFYCILMFVVFLFAVSTPIFSIISLYRKFAERK